MTLDPYAGICRGCSLQDNPNPLTSCRLSIFCTHGQLTIRATGLLKPVTCFYPVNLFAAFEAFCQTPSEVMARVDSGIQTLECCAADLSKLKMLDSVVKETLRLHSTAPIGTTR